MVSMMKIINSKKNIKWENIHMIGDDKEYRYILQNEGNNPLMVIGVNPSTANESTPDATMRKVMGFAEYNGFDSFIMVNLYPQRTTDPNRLDKIADFELNGRNCNFIKEALSKMGRFPTVLCAWGNLIKKRRYLGTCLTTIVEAIASLQPQYKCINTTNAGHPVHPLYQKYCRLKQFDILDYITDVL